MSWRRRNSGAAVTGSFVLLSAVLATLPLSGQLQTPKTIILIGPPASGKTVQAQYLRKRYKIPAISMDQLLHEEIGRKSSMGQSLASSLTSGELLADGPANDLIEARLLRSDIAHGFILDGYPVTDVQAKALDAWLVEHKFPPPVIVILDVPEDVSRERLRHRRRADDTPGNTERRLTDYKDLGRRTEQWYGTDRVARVDGNGTVAEVAERMAKAVESVKGKKELKTREPEKTLKQREPEP